MTMIYDIPRDLIEEILSRVSITCLRSTCKRWNALSKDQSFTKKHCGQAAKEFMGIMTYNVRDCLTSVNLHRIHNHKDGLFNLPINQLGKFNLIKISEVLYCDGLLLCININKDMLVVWNPYLGQVRWIQPKNKFDPSDQYGIGYDNNRNHKILRFLGYNGFSVGLRVGEYEIYDFKHNSWRVLDVTPDWQITSLYQRGVSLKGNTYFVVHERVEFDQGQDLGDFLVCFDFTRDVFGPRLQLPFHSSFDDYVILSTVREEQLAVLFKRPGADMIEIWVTT